MADIFVSYTSGDRNWAFWIAQELKRLGHVPRVHEWEIDAGGDVPAWMEERLQKADRVLCVISREYLTKDYSGWERRSAQWAAASKRPNFMLPVYIDDCEPPVAMAHIKRCRLYDASEDEARARLEAYLTEAKPPAGPAAFPGSKQAHRAPPDLASAAVFPGGRSVLSNIPFAIPRHFLGRDDALAAIDAGLTARRRAAITALHGLRGVGKTTLAAAYAELRRADYRATWWIRAETPETMRADLVALGVGLGWVAADAKEEEALKPVLARLRDEGEGLLLVYDNAVGTKGLAPFLPPGGAAQILVTSNAPDWGRIAAPVEIRVWPKDIGADYLIARTGRAAERDDAEALSDTLGGLPLAHEQAAAYCERLGVSLADYRRRFAAAPARRLDDARDAPPEYHDGLTVAKTFALAIDEAAKLHPAAEPLIVHAALLAPEPIPLFLFAEGRKKLGEPLASLIVDDGLDEAVAALRAFALVEREPIADERDPSIVTDTIRLHRLVRLAAAGRWPGDAVRTARLALIEAMAEVYPGRVESDPAAWRRARRLDALALDLLGAEEAPAGAELSIAQILGRLGVFRFAALAAYAEARPLLKRSLKIRERLLDPDDPEIAASLGSLAGLFLAKGDLARARQYSERALAITEKAFGPEHRMTAVALNNLAAVLQDQNNLLDARPLYERALKIWERENASDDIDIARPLNNYARLLQAQGDLEGALPRFERSMALREQAFGPDHPLVATTLNNIAILYRDRGEFARAKAPTERALKIREASFGPDHPETSLTRANLAYLLLKEGAPAEALRLAEQALAAHDRALGPDHAWTRASARFAAEALDALGQGGRAAAIRARHGLSGAKSGAPKRR